MLTTTLTTGVLLLLSGGESILEPPVRIHADGAPIDTGDNWGHSGPCFADFDGDGLKDLVVGDFSGKFHFFRNVGKPKDPRFTRVGYLQSGGQDARVHIY
jgi:hypothetical protein